MARGVEEDQVGAGAGVIRPMSVRRRAAAPPAVADQIASSGVIPMSRTASAIQNGTDEVNDEPGLQSVESATVAPASRRRRASGQVARVENSAPGSSVATVLPWPSASTSASVRWVQWSADAASSSTASWTPGPYVSWLAWIRGCSPLARPAVRMARAWSPSKAPCSQNTSIQRACGAQASSIGPVTRSTYPAGSSA